MLKNCKLSGLSLKCYEYSDETKLGEAVECPDEANACLKAVAGTDILFMIKSIWFLFYDF